LGRVTLKTKTDTIDKKPYGRHRTDCHHQSHDQQT
jgi:hypothetical protein